MQKLKEYKWFIAFFGCLLGFVLVTDFNGLYGQDSYEYLRYTKCLVAFFKTGTNPGDFFWPLIYPVTGAILSFVFKPVFALQFISIASFIGASIYLKKIIRRLYSPTGESAMAYTVLIFMLSPYMLRASMVVMSDTLCVFFLTAAFNYFLQYRADLTVKSFQCFVLFAVAAVATRYGAFVLLLLPACIVAYTFIKNINWKALPVSFAIIGILVLPHFIVRRNNPLAFIGHEWLRDWSPVNFFKNSFVTADGNAHYTIYNILYSFFNFFHPAFLFAGLVLLVITIKNMKENKSKAIWISILLYALFLAGIPLQNLRFLQLSFPLVAIVLFPAFKTAYDYLVGVRKLERVGVLALCTIIAIIQLGLFYRVFVPFYNDNKNEKQIALEVLKYPGIPIYTFSIDGALRAYGADNNIINLYNVQLDSTNIIKGEKLVLFNEKQFQEEFKGQRVMDNWAVLKKNLRMDKIEDLPEGWCLSKAE